MGLFQASFISDVFLKRCLELVHRMVLKLNSQSPWHVTGFVVAGTRFDCGLAVAGTRYIPPRLKTLLATEKA